jgi:hypothetical protein
MKQIRKENSFDDLYLNFYINNNNNNNNSVNMCERGPSFNSDIMKEEGSVIEQLDMCDSESLRYRYLYYYM